MKAILKDVTSLVSNFNSKIIQKSLKEGKRAYIIVLPKFAGLLKYEIGKRRVAKELVDVIKRLGVKGIIHSDELPNYGITEENVKQIRDFLNINEEDAFIIYLVEPEKYKIIAEAIINRLNEMIKSIPKDTRQALEDGTTAFLRPRPGASRMYPETDHPLIFIEKTKDGYLVKYGDKEFIYKPKKIDYDKIFQYLKEKTNENLANAIIKSEHVYYIMELFEKYKNIKPTIIASIFFNPDVKIDYKKIDIALNALSKGLITKEALVDVINSDNPEKTINELKALSKEEAKTIIMDLIKKHGKKAKAIAFKELRKRVDPKIINEIFQELEG
ncbi:NEQ396 [Nanoarchaeum equitans Kin4-M]|uniref:NEQ396 n=1 Tax=Nanoarchaeum equitans (strain Kin4-M) TaxID=228908 RepID=Q74N23_NANEQ|nr:NEQ396 [Nanoarchaeum equitans Kin4-M]